ncbi:MULTISPECIES: prephenate dehydrogenase [unclassified Romboutsia]|uniref:prephenate dehydrogenase n=1 Tax=unclassified Romboutsia TaxID=2626894 RepID=UPI00082166FA|nr:MULTISPECIES: prephenate dehydrogenase [unclassified Romboutsia]SCH91616.1 Arogenate dehydrogenase [uncultured Clostridium sp.]
MNIVIVGLGVIGGSFAMALKEAGYNDVYGIDINEQTIIKAKEMNIIKDGSTKGSNLIRHADLVIISIYPTLIKSFIEENKYNFKKGSIITDTTGIKGMFIDEVLKMLPKGVDFVFGHPMAGREKKGLDFASSSVFKGANYILINADHNNEENIEIVESLIYSIGFKNVKKVSASFHDEIISFTSQLPHAIAVALINSDEEGRDTGSFIGDSYRDLTRIANINEELWCELFMGNKDNFLNSMNKFLEEINKIKICVEKNDNQKLVEYFKKSSIRRQQL